MPAASVRELTPQPSIQALLFAFSIFAWIMGFSHNLALFLANDVLDLRLEINGNSRDVVDVLRCIIPHLLTR